MSRTVRAGYQRRTAARLPRMTATNALVDATSAVLPDEIERLRSTVGAALPRYVDDLATLVDIDCGSYTKAGVDRVGDFVAERLSALGARVEVRPHERFGNTVLGRFEGS